ncbi:MAG TPA: MarR family transcriptional regulator [Candidatus Methylacidiphilales bacterium]|jgi:DNA-binding MarR family transcriptional regulator|nr:MarR family transcriptional regulator [Candidatus Methylacidiphilales bacterium]
MERKPEPHDLLVALLLVQSLLERRSEAFFQPFGLTGAQFNILNLLAAHEGRMDQAALGDLLLVGKSSISIVLNRMVRDSLVKREEHPKDRRQVVLTLTPKGRALWRKISPRYEAGVKGIFGALQISRRQRFLDDLKVLHDAFLAEEGNAESEDRWHSHFSPGQGAS